MNTKFNKHSIAFLFSNNFFFLQINYYKKLQKKVTQQNQPEPKTIQCNDITYSHSSCLVASHWIYTFTVDYIYLYIYSPIYHSNQHIFNVSFKEHILETYPILRLFIKHIPGNKSPEILFIKNLKNQNPPQVEKALSRRVLEADAVNTESSGRQRILKTFHIQSLDEVHHALTSVG